MENINQTQLKEWLSEGKDLVLLDVRSEGEVMEGMIPGAINMNMMSPTFAQDVKSLDTDKEYVVICRSGNRSASAGSFMFGNGFSKVYNLMGGMMSWNGDVVVN
jgi:rhodanese-related sulfurtransferase